MYLRSISQIKNRTQFICLTKYQYTKKMLPLICGLGKHFRTEHKFTRNNFRIGVKIQFYTFYKGNVGMNNKKCCCETTHFHFTDNFNIIHLELKYFILFVYLFVSCMYKI